MCMCVALEPQQQSEAGIYVKSAHTVCSFHHLPLHVTCEKLEVSMCLLAVQAHMIAGHPKAEPSRSLTTNRTFIYTITQ